MTKRQKGKRKFIIIGLIAALVLVILILKITNQDDGRTKVKYVYPERRTIVQTINANGRIQPVFEVKLSPEVSGEITLLPVIEGQYVDKGTLLCRIKPDMYISMRERAVASLSTSTSRVEQAKVRLKQEKQNFARAEQLHAAKAMSDAEFENARASFAIAKGALKDAKFAEESAKAALREATENLNKTTIYAPVSAYVSRLEVKAGQRVVGTAQMAGTNLMTLADLKKMEARVNVSESDIVRVHVGDSAEVRVDAYPDTVFMGVVTQVANSANATQSMDQVTNYEVRIFLLPESYTQFAREDLPSPFKPGMSVSVDILSQKEVNVVSLPIESVTARPDSTGKMNESGGWQKKMLEVVFTIENDSARLHTVNCGIQDSRYIEIKGELDDSTKVIVAPYSAVSRTLYNGMPVHGTKQEDK